MISEFLNIKRGDKGKAPHKPLLLLTLIELLEKGLVVENQFKPDQQFKEIFKSITEQLVKGRKSPITPLLPFCHLESDGFWKHSLNYGKKVRLSKSGSPSGWNSITAAVEYASLDPEIFLKLQNPEIRASTKRLLLLTYFPDSYASSNLLDTPAKELLRDIEHDFFIYKVAEDPPIYRNISRLERESYFKTKLPYFYKYTCAVSQAATNWNSKYGLLEACHIIPVKEKSIYAIQNGILLSPTLHSAFDEHLISITPEYKVIVSESIIENPNSPFNLKQFHGVKIQLPEKKEWFPSQEALEWHRSKLI